MVSRKRVEAGDVTIEHVRDEDNPSDFLTKISVPGLRGRRVLHWIDNTGVISALTKCPTPPMADTDRP